MTSQKDTPQSAGGMWQAPVPQHTGVTGKTSAIPVVPNPSPVPPNGGHLTAGPFPMLNPLQYAPAPIKKTSSTIPTRATGVPPATQPPAFLPQQTPTWPPSAPAAQTPPTPAWLPVGDAAIKLEPTPTAATFNSQTPQAKVRTGPVPIKAEKNTGFVPVQTEGGLFKPSGLPVSPVQPFGAAPHGAGMPQPPILTPPPLPLPTISTTPIASGNLQPLTFAPPPLPLPESAPAAVQPPSPPSLVTVPGLGPSTPINPAVLAPNLVVSLPVSPSIPQKPVEPALPPAPSVSPALSTPLKASPQGSVPPTAEPVKPTSGDMAMRLLESPEYYLAMVSKRLCFDWDIIMKRVQENRISDIIFGNGRIFGRQAGVLVEFPEEYQVSKEDYEKGLISVIPNKHVFTHLTGKDGATDFAVELADQRVRGNIFLERGGLAGAFRPIASKVIPAKAQDIDDRVMKLILTSKQGLILIAGPTGSGKSTTVVGMLEEINQAYAYNIITIEDPIEFLFTPKKSRISQREVGVHAGAFDVALRSAMRQNPDVIFVGEIRDYPTMAAALKAAETGHLVFATVHTRRVYTTLNRLINIAPASERDQIRDAISQNVLMILCQRLIPSRDGNRVPCREVIMRCNALIGVINSGKMRDLNNVMLSNRQNGMIDWANALKSLVERKLITEAEAEKYQDREDAS